MHAYVTASQSLPFITRGPDVQRTTKYSECLASWIWLLIFLLNYHFIVAGAFPPSLKGGEEWRQCLDCKGQTEAPRPLCPPPCCPNWFVYDWGSHNTLTHHPCVRAANWGNIKALSTHMNIQWSFQTLLWKESHSYSQVKAVWHICCGAHGIGCEHSNKYLCLRNAKAHETPETPGFLEAETS